MKKLPVGGYLLALGEKLPGKGGTGAAAGGSGGGQHQTFLALAMVNPSKTCTGPPSHPSRTLRNPTLHKAYNAHGSNSSPVLGVAVNLTSRAPRANPGSRASVPPPSAAGRS